MSTLSAARLLDVWEQGAGAPPYARALLLLAAAWPSIAQAELAGWSLGRRDAALLDLRELLFGGAIESLAVCPQCGAQSELSFRTSDIRAPFASGDLRQLQERIDGHAYRVWLRPITTAALIAVVGDSRREALLLQCIAEAQRDDAPLPPADLPAEVLTRCGTALAEADPQADIQLALTCIECAEQWSAPFDPTGFLWREIEIWAERMLREVHLLASAYGWSETDILALSAARRRRYLEMVTA
ncbi:MAG TPA: hypothetical protein VFU22_21035 [Roseiflexaceae bacterium]|nr:hypothetical protein [Roseiflexaceae bacterium]